MEAGLIQALVGSGPLGLLILYLMATRKSDREDRKAEVQERTALDKDRIETDKAMVAALTGLAGKIDQLGHGR